MARIYNYISGIDIVWCDRQKKQKSIWLYTGKRLEPLLLWHKRKTQKSWDSKGRHKKYGQPKRMA